MNIDKESLRKVMSELGKRSYKARQKKYGKNYMRELVLKRWKKHRKAAVDN